MPKGGHNRKSNAELELAGTRRPYRHGRKGEDVALPDGVPSMPDNLSDTAKMVWNRTLSELKKVGQMKRCYEASLAGFSALYGEFLDDPQGFAAHKHGHLRQYITELGLGPVASTRLRGDGKPEPEPDPARF